MFRHTDADVGIISARAFFFYRFFSLLLKLRYGKKSSPRVTNSNNSCRKAEQYGAHWLATFL